MMSTLFLSMMMIEPAVPAQAGDAVLYVATYVDVQLGSIDQGSALIKQYQAASHVDAGNSSVHVVREVFRPNRFVIIEVWKDQSSFDAHERAAHTAEFRARLKTIQNSPFDQRMHRGFAIDPRPASAGGGILSVVTHVDVPPQRREETEVLLKGLAENSRKDEGNLRYDVFQQSVSRNHFTISAAWKDRKAFDTHEIKAHTRQFRDALEPMLGAPYDERLYAPLP